MKYSPALLESFLQIHESIIWTLMGRFDSLNVLTGRRLKRGGCMIATPWRLLFVSLTRDTIQLESIPFNQIQDLQLREQGLFHTLSFNANGNPCRLRCLFNQPVRMNMYWLRQRCQSLEAATWSPFDQL
jgi:hypothetical protein